MLAILLIRSANYIDVERDLDQENLSVLLNVPTRPLDGSSLWEQMETHRVLVLHFPNGRAYERFVDDLDTPIVTLRTVPDTSIAHVNSLLATYALQPVMEPVHG